MNEGKVYNSVHDGVINVRKGRFYVSFKGTLFPFWANIAAKPRHQLTVFFPGSTRRQKPLPIFQRQTFSDQIDSDVICAADPTLFYSKDITMAWFAGDRSRHFAATAGMLLNAFIKQKGYADVLVYGTSAGGIPVLQAAKHIKNSSVTACVGNAQLNVFSYYKNHFRKLLEVAFNKMEPDAFSEKFSSRVNMLGYEADCRIICMQNVDDAHHYEKHYLPFKEAYKGNGRGTFVEYSEPSLGHEPLPKELEIQMIQAILAKSTDPFSNVPNARVSIV